MRRGVVLVKIACGAVFFCPCLLTSRSRLDYTAERQSVSGAKGLMNQYGLLKNDNIVLEGDQGLWWRQVFGAFFKILGHFYFDDTGIDATISGWKNSLADLAQQGVVPFRELVPAGRPQQRHGVPYDPHGMDKT